jgi:2-C-methyl-D-erythritol 2,4-cyclodiphosphate synthase
VHDAARPFVSHPVIDACVAAVRRYGAAVVARPLTDTVKRATPEDDVDATVARDRLWGAQTPQGFRFPLLFDAYRRAVAEDWPATDDAGVVERAGHRVHLVEGEAMNFKITRPEDLEMAERLAGEPPRIGIGYDVHRLAPDRPLVLGGITVPHETGLLGHSDADVLTHALMDALLGAAALGDIGQLFPDTDPHFRGISSIHLLAQVADHLRKAGFLPVNVDAVIVAQAPKLAPFLDLMRRRLAATLALPQERVSVKATTTEGLGFTGMREGIAAYATACIRLVNRT